MFILLLNKTLCKQKHSLYDILNSVSWYENFDWFKFEITPQVAIFCARNSNSLSRSSKGSLLIDDFENETRKHHTFCGNRKDIILMSGKEKIRYETLVGFAMHCCK